MYGKRYAAAYENEETPMTTALILTEAAVVISVAAVLPLSILATAVMAAEVIAGD